MILEALGLNVLVKEIKKSELLKSGLFIPGTAHDGPLCRAEILSIGKGGYDHGQWVYLDDGTQVIHFQVGDIVVIDRTYAKVFGVEDQDSICYIISYKDILLKENN